MASVIHSVGVDRGGTWIRVEALDAHNCKLRSVKVPSPTIPQLPMFLRKLFKRWNAHPKQLAVGSRGVWKPTARKQLQKALRPLADHVQVMSDVEAAWHAAFRRPPGVIVIAGTGSIALGIDRKGRKARAGGLGPLKGDEGSAFWIGKQTMNHQPKSLTPQVIRRIASAAPRVFQRAQKGDLTAQQIISAAQGHLVHLALQVARSFPHEKRLPLSWGGSVLNHDKFRAGFLTALRRHSVSTRFLIRKPGVSTAQAIAQLPQ